VVEESAAAGIGPIVTVGMDVPSSRAAAVLAAELPGVKAAVGLHPWHVAELYRGPDSLEPYRELAADPAVAAISEVGLDTVTCEVPIPEQQELLRWFVELARERRIPLILHHRADASALVEVWRTVGEPRPKVAIHGFLGSADDARAFLGEGFLLSIGPSSLALVGDDRVDDETLRLVPEDRPLVDSDAFTAAMGWPEVHPTILDEVVERIARARGDESEAVRGAIARNFHGLL
jgi:TatD DNase family protein